MVTLDVDPDIQSMIEAMEGLIHNSDQPPPNQPLDPPRLLPTNPLTKTLTRNPSPDPPEPEPEPEPNPKPEPEPLT
jgi:hypothetical protein